MAKRNLIEDIQVGCYPLSELSVVSPRKFYRKYDKILARRVARAGIIPYYTDGGTIFFLLGLDSGSEITDFSGGPKPIDSNILDTAIREYDEESGQCAGDMEFLKRYPDDVYYLRWNSYVTIFVKAAYDREECLKRFDAHHHKDDEVSRVEWISLENLQQLVNRENRHRDLYIPLRIILKQGLDQWLHTK